MKKNYFSITMISIGWLLISMSHVSARSMSVDEAIKLAKDNSPELRIERLTLEGVKNQIALHATELLPKLDFIADQSKNHIFDYRYVASGSEVLSELTALENRRYDMKLVLNQKIVDWAFFTKHSALKEQQQATLAAYNQKEAELSFEVVTAYYLFLKAEQTRQLIQADINLLESYLQDIKNKALLRFEDRQVVLNTEINLQNKKQELYNYQKDYYAKRNELARLLFIPLTLEFSLMSFEEIAEVVIDHQSILSTSQRLHQALERRWDVKQWHHKERAYGNEANSLYQAFLPDFNAQFTCGYLDAYNFSTDAEDEYWQITLSATWNLFNGFYDVFKIKEVNIEREKAQEAITNLEQTIKSEINNASYHIEVLGKMLDDVKYNQIIAQENVAVAQKKLILQHATKEDLLSAKLMYNNARQQYVQVKIDLLLAQKNYQYIMGTL